MHFELGKYVKLFFANSLIRQSELDATLSVSLNKWHLHGHGRATTSARTIKPHSTFIGLHKAFTVVEAKP